jgi:hypothetical protein
MPGKSMIEIELQGLIDAQKALRAVGGKPADAKILNRTIVEQELIPPSKANAPVRSGRLRDSILAESSPQYGYILSGKKWGVPYASVIHYGWATRGLGRTTLGGSKVKGLATGSRKRGEQLVALSRRTATQGISDKELKRAATRSMDVRTKAGDLKKRAVRGGPIEPNPFIYEAIDERARWVYERYQDAITTRAQIEGLL